MPRSVAGLSAALALLLLAAPAGADTIKLRSGRTVSGRIVRIDARVVVVDVGAGGTVAYPRDIVAEIPGFATAGRAGHLIRSLPSLARATERFASLPWASPGPQVPSVLRTSDVLSQVPARTFSLAGGAFLTVFGDADAPGAFEFALYGSQARDLDAQGRLLEAVYALSPALAAADGSEGIDLRGSDVTLDNFRCIIEAPDQDTWRILLADEVALATARLPLGDARLQVPLAETDATGGWSAEDLAQTPGSGSPGTAPAAWVRSFRRTAGRFIPGD